MRRTATLLLTALLGAAASLTLPALPALAADITVTTATDVVDPLDGLVSLREAVDEANAAVTPTTILLAGSATYALDLCGVDEDANLDGDLDYTGDQPLAVDGNGATIAQTCAGQRVLQTTSATAGVTFNDTTLTGGDQFDGAAVLHAGDLFLHRVTVAGNAAGAGSVLASDSGVTGTTLDLVDSVVGPNTGTGVDTSFGTVTITGSTITGHTGRGVGLVDGALTMAGSLVEQNDGDGVRTTGQGTGLFTLTGTVVRDNGGTGVACSNCGDLAVTGSEISGNGGGGVTVHVDLDPPHDLAVTITRSSVVDNQTDGPGAGLAVLITELPDDAPVPQVLITESTFAGNTATGADGRGGAVFAETGEVRVDNSTISGNAAAVSGGGVFTAAEDAFLRHATVVDNAAPTGANLATAGDLSAAASIVASGAGGGTDCAVAGTTLSGGHNVGGDASCAFVAGPGDQDAAGDPQVGLLQDNGGPTPTRVPQAGSPAVGAVPATACTILSADQRGVARPQGTDCEAGAVEVDERPGSPGGGGGLPVTGFPALGLVLLGVALLAGGAALMAVRRRPPPGPRTSAVPKARSPQVGCSTETPTAS